MVDKGFRVDKVCQQGIKIHRPPVMEKKQQLSAPKAKENVVIANARVHIERIMQRLKVFKILQGKIPWSMTPYNIFTLIAGLVNVGPPILADERFMTFESA